MLFAVLRTTSPTIGVQRYANRFCRVLPLPKSEVPQFRYAAPILVRHEGDEYLRKVHPCDEEGERYHEHEEGPLIGTKLADIRQQVVKIQVLGLLFLVVVPTVRIVAFLGAPLLVRRGSIGRGRGRRASVGTPLDHFSVPGEILLRWHLAIHRDLRSSPWKERRQHFLRAAATIAIRLQPLRCCAALARARATDFLRRSARLPGSYLRSKTRNERAPRTRTKD